MGLRLSISSTIAQIIDLHAKWLKITLVKTLKARAFYEKNHPCRNASKSSRQRTWLFTDRETAPQQCSCFRNEVLCTRPRHHYTFIARNHQSPCPNTSAEQAGYFIDFKQIERDEMINVMITSFNGDEKPLATLLENITSIIE